MRFRQDIGRLDCEIAKTSDATILSVLKSNVMP